MAEEQVEVVARLAWPVVSNKRLLINALFDASLLSLKDYEGTDPATRSLIRQGSEARSRLVAPSLAHRQQGGQTSQTLCYCYNCWACTGNNCKASRPRRVYS